MNHGSLFSGIGGFDLAVEWMGWNNKFHCEWNDYGRTLLNQKWPQAESYGDITKTDFTFWNGQIDIITGGFPCQPFSVAGKRKGEEDSRYLWPEMLRCIREIEPAFVVAENVSGLVTMANGETLEWVLSDLENEGYIVEPCLIPACGIGAWHRRERIWICAYHQGSPIERERFQRSRERKYRGLGSEDAPNSDNLLHTGELDEGGNRATTKRSEGANEQEREASHRERVWIESGASGEDATHTSSKRPQEQRQSGRSCHSAKNGEWQVDRAFDDGIWEFEPGVGRVADGIPHRVDRLQALGNAIVPQVAYEIFQAIEALLYEQEGGEVTRE
jgi:DNA (cytosine-5)-methyltransferase 1